MSTLRSLVVFLGVGAIATTGVLAGCAERPGIKKKDDDDDKKKKGDKKKDDKKKDDKKKDDKKKDDKKKSE